MNFIGSYNALENKVAKERNRAMYYFLDHDMEMRYKLEVAGCLNETGLFANVDRRWESAGGGTEDTRKTINWKCWRDVIFEIFI